MVDLSDVAERVAVLEHFPFEDDQPNIEAPSLALLYNAYTDYNLADRGAYDTRWTEETQAIAQLRDILKQGDNYINMLYTYRSCSKAIPQVKTSDQANKNEIYEATYEVLEPEIKKLKAFMYYRRDTTKAFCEHIKKLGVWLVPDKKGKLKEDYTPSETYLWYMIQLLDKFALLDALKNMKACLNNDFSFYKRAFGFLRKNMTGNDDQTQENHTLYLFLAHQNSITTELKTELQQIPGFDDVLTVIVDTCADILEAGRYLLPNEKHCLLRVMPYVLFLMDGEQNSQYNIFKSKKLKLNRFSSIFKKYPVVPLYGDMQITLDSTIKRSPHFDEKAWGGGADVKSSVEYEVIAHLENVQNLHNEFLAKFGNMINEIKAIQRDGKPVGFALAKEVTSTVLQGFQYISDWTDKILQQSAWKYAKPNNDPTIESTVDYERVVRFNYKPEEKFALVEFIGMIKGLASVMLREDGLLSPIIRHCIHDEVQEFIQIGLRDLIRVATKKKKKELRGDLMQLRSIGADWFSGTEPVSDPVLQGKKSKDNDRIQIPSRAVGPSPTQLELIRSVTFGLLYRKKEYKAAQTKVLEDFYDRSFFYSYLLDYSGTILAASDLGDLWYKEFYLELSKKLQFPIDMSLPWILTDHILESREPSMIEYVFYPLDLYNDSANRALNSLHQQFLYDEIEAEVNLCFDQLVYKISDQIYTHFKTHAASILLDKSYKTQLETIYSAHRLHVPKSRYEVLLKQRHIHLLGRSIDLNNLITQRMNTYLRQNIDHAISRFEASDICSIVELDSLLANVRYTYRLLSEYFELDPWDSILTEVNESTSLVSFHGRIILHIIFELVYDFGSNFNYNSITNRFIRTPLSFSDEVPRDSMPKTNPTFLWGSKVMNGAYANAMELFKNFFGTQHINSILHLVGRSNLPLIVSECLQNMDLKLRNVLAPYVRELMGGMPSTKLPIHDYGTEGGYGYFQLKLKDIIIYPDLRPEVLQNFREMGNLIIFLKMCDFGLSQLEAMTSIVAAPFLGITADKNQIVNGDPSAASPLYTATVSVASILESKPGLAKAPGIMRELVNNAWKADKFYRPSGQNISLFKSTVQRISNMLDSVRGEWCGTAPENGVMSVDTTTEFYRLWSALQFVCCIATGENELSNHELFGDGLFWSGCTIIHFLGQQLKFEVFDFSYHILNVEEGSSVPCNSPMMLQFFKKVAQTRDLNQTIFNTLRAYCSPPPDQTLILHPPETDLAESQFISVTSGDSGHVPIPKQPSYQNTAAATSQSQPPPPPGRSMPPPPPNMSVPPPPPSYEPEGGDYLPPPPPDMDGSYGYSEGYTEDQNYDAPPPPPPRDW
eukprot:TRINITY_DN5592_c0_g1_i1.p1 TRINITY_DN5592_c0_g1~~TRINITY_DN5592_c0_g1_i1.p1  ORF type:complete len:1338 (-),score=458.14 TRINITY_DN5592_c0_g1_i1:118-4131(-)